jgi:hypothetical protein
VEGLIRKYRVKAVLVSGIASLSEHVFNSIARAKGLPVVIWQQGFIGYNNGITQLHNYNELMSTTHDFVYGEDTREALEKSNLEGFGTRVVAVGSSGMDALKAESRKAGLERGGKGAASVLYATTNYYRNVWYCGFSPPFSDRALFMDQRRIISFLSEAAKNYGIGATVKLHPSLSSLRPDDVEGEGVNFIRYEKGFMDLLLSHDVVVIDMPTTTILQAVATRKPIFVLMGQLRYSEYERGMLEKRAVCSESVEEMIRKLDEYLVSGRYDADVNDDTFLRSYCTYLDDGRSSERAASEILRILERTGD